MELPPMDPSSFVAIVLGPVSLGALLAALVWWLKTRPPGNGPPPKS
jgi:hypothetical protein